MTGWSRVGHELGDFAFAFERSYVAIRSCIVPNGNDPPGVSRVVLLGNPREIRVDPSWVGSSFHDTTHYFPLAPRWLHEGLAQFLSTARLEDGGVVVGRVPRGYRWDSSRWTALTRSKKCSHARPKHS